MGKWVIVGSSNYHSPGMLVFWCRRSRQNFDEVTQN